MKHLLGLTCASVMALTASTGAYAQSSAQTAPSQAETVPAPEGSSQIEDIVVTAQKRETSLQRTPAAITAVGGESLAALGVTDQSRLAKLVPGLVIGDQGGTGRFFIRGIGQSLGSNNAQPGVSVNFNGTYWPREPGVTPLFDLERVEVLPGPQGTLWGRNAAGGAINFIPRRPTRDLEGYGILEVGNYELIHPTAVINIPFGDSFAVRAAVDYNHRDGYLTNGANDKEDISGRLSLLYDNNAGASVLLTGMYSHGGGVGNQAVLFREDGGAVAFQPDPSKPYNRSFATDRLFQDTNLYFVQAEVKLDLSDSITLTYLPAYLDFDGDRVNQFSGTLPTVFDNYARQMTHEVRLAGNRPDLNWVVGLYYHDAEHDLKNTLGVLLPTPVGRVQFHNELKGYALFGEATYSASDKLRLTLGGRYSIDKFDGFAFLSAPPFSAANPLIGPGRNTERNFDVKVGVQYDLAERSMLYATYQTGYLMGGFTQDGRLFKPETVTAYTAGVKNRFADGRIQLNLEAFYYDYKDYQLQYVQGTTFLTDNAPARVYGAQVDLALKVGEGGTFTLNGLINNATIRTRTMYLRDGISSSIFGFQLPDAPTLTLTAGYQHRISLANGGALIPRGQIYYNSGYWMVFTHDRNTRQEAYTTTDLSLTYEAPSNRWNIGAFVRNLEDDDVYVGANKPAANAAAASYIQPPRTYGIRAEFRF